MCPTTRCSGQSSADASTFLGPWTLWPESNRPLRATSESAANIDRSVKGIFGTQSSGSLTVEEADDGEEFTGR